MKSRGLRKIPTCSSGSYMVGRVLLRPSSPTIQHIYTYQIKKSVQSTGYDAVIGEDQENFIASTGFFHLRPTGVPSEFLLMLMRSTVVQMQLRQQATGGILSAAPVARVKYIIVPKLNGDVQKEIAEKVQEAHKQHKESLALLSTAKARVEELIETATK